MRQLNTLRARFALWTAALFLLVLTVFGVYVYAAMAHSLFTALDDSLVLSAAQVVASLNIDNGQLILPDSLAEPPDNTTGNTAVMIIRVVSPSGQVLQTFGTQSSLPLPSQAVVAAPVFVTWSSLRIYSAPVTDSNRVLAMVQVARSTSPEQETLQRLLATLLLGIPLLVAAAGVSGYFLAARALAPVDAITRAAARISAADLSARLNLPTNDDEVGRLARTFDAMLTRLDDAFQRERRFTSDASHELRTPLTAMRAILGVTREKPRTSEEYEQALADLAEETNRLHALVENLLQLARREPRTAAAYEAIDLATLLCDVTDSLRPLAEDKGLTLEYYAPGPLPLQGDSDDLIRLFVNLLDNAVKYTRQGAITVSARRDLAGRVSVTIADTGIGIPAEHLPHIFERFYRADQSRTTPGAGLGLAIAADIARAHGGTLEASSAAGKGTCFTIRLPQKRGS